jgi:hypothetical protein
MGEKGPFRQYVSRCLSQIKREREHHGQGLLEFAIILPVMLISFFTIIELGRLYHAWSAVENGARFGIRYAITGEFDSSKCSGPCDDSDEEEFARLATVKDAVWAGSESIIRMDEGSGSTTDQGFFNVTVCPPDDLVDPASQYDTFSCSSGEYAGDPGEKVAVVVEYNHPILVPIISSIVPQIRLTAERESTVETFREVKADAAPGYSPPPPPPAFTPEPTSTPEESGGSTYDYCANIDTALQWWDQSLIYDKMWKFGNLFFNNNNVSMYLYDYTITHTGGLYRNRTKTIRYHTDSTRPKIITSDHYLSPISCYTSGTWHCGSSSNIEYPPQSGCSDPDDCWYVEIYTEYCKTSTCSFNEPWSTNTNQVITGSGYTFQGDAIFVFRASDTGESEDVFCPVSWSAAGNAPDHSGGSGGQYYPTPAPTPDGSGGGGGSPTATPDTGSPGD